MRAVCYIAVFKSPDCATVLQRDWDASGRDSAHSAVRFGTAESRRAGERLQVTLTMACICEGKGKSSLSLHQVFRKVEQNHAQRRLPS